MEQKQRNKIAWVLIAVLVPLLIYLLVTNVAKVRKTPSPPSPTAFGVFPSPGAGVIPPGAEVQPPTRQLPPVDTRVLAEQKRIAALLPKNNPFNPSRTSVVDPLPVTAAPAAPAPRIAPDAVIKLTAILRQGGAARMAMINGRLLGEGERVAGWTIIKVNINDVLLENGARQMVLKLK